MSTSLALTGRQHSLLKQHLFPGDRLEAVALLLCGLRRGQDETVLLVRSVKVIPYTACKVREPDRVTWSTDLLPNIFEEARTSGYAVVKIHSHTADYRRFSPIDDASDRELFPGIHAWMDAPAPHSSAVMLPDGQIFGRVVHDDGRFEPLRRIRLVGDDIAIWPGTIADRPAERDHRGHGQRVAQTFGAATYALLGGLRIAVIGCSGTGSLVVEQLARNCIGELVLVDPKPVEERNLNRIPQATAEDARMKRLKVDVMERAINAMGTGVRVTKHARDIHDPKVLRDLAHCDVIFGCMDTVDGRHTLNRLASFYLLPYFDVGVKLVADGAGGIETVVGTVHYLQPDGSSMLSRKVYTMEQVEAAALARQDPREYADRRARGYIAGVNEDRPAVISVNMLYASLAVNEFLARLHPYRITGNAGFAVHRLCLSDDIYEHEDDGVHCALLSRHTGRGDIVPMLGLPELSEVA